MANFETAVNSLFQEEGGYVNDKADAGGETKYGISKRSYPNLDIKNLTISDAGNIYKRDFWLPNRYASINDQTVATKVLSMAVNMGSINANILLQRSCNECGEMVVADGVIGPVTLAAINRLDGKILLEVYRQKCREYYYKIVMTHPKFEKFLKGWIKRAEA